MSDDVFGGPGVLLSRTADAPAGEAGGGVHDVEDTDGTYAAWLDDLDAHVVLVRPDFHLYGTGGPDDAAALAAGFLAALGTGPAAGTETVPPEAGTPLTAH
ncbi:hypothetical protein [Streptomyces sp. NPDC006134]|uniref:hypothetical protein n=1 Tax=Streptomyces sp. NPDC006134 TaxID=3154467 RepID=UPI0033C11D10